MKRIVVFLIATFMVTGIYAQKKNVVATYNYLRYGKLDKAKNAIDQAVENEKTIGEAKTWFFAGNVYLAIQLSEEEKFKSLDPDALDVAYKAYQRSLEIDEKNEYSGEVKDRIQVCAEQYFNKGVSSYNDQTYVEAMEAFAQSAEINSQLGKTDSVAVFYAAQSGYFAEKYEAAKVFFEQLLEMKYQDPGMYRIIADIYKKDGDTIGAIEIVQQGREVYPDDYNLIIDAANIYLSTGENQKALDVLTIAIEKESTNATLFFAAGTIYDKVNDFEGASDLYQKAIGVDPEYFDANYNLGALYFNKAVEMISTADALPLNEEEKYNQLKEDANKMMERALPFLEKADSITPSDEVTLQTLKEIYTRLQMVEKRNIINERLSDF